MKKILVLGTAQAALVAALLLQARSAAAFTVWDRHSLLAGSGFGNSQSIDLPDLAPHAEAESVFEPEPMDAGSMHVRSIADSSTGLFQIVAQGDIYSGVPFTLTSRRATATMLEFIQVPQTPSLRLNLKLDVTGVVVSQAATYDVQFSYGDCSGAMHFKFKPDQTGPAITKTIGCSTDRSQMTVDPDGTLMAIDYGNYAKAAGYDNVHVQLDLSFPSSGAGKIDVQATALLSIETDGEPIKATSPDFLGGAPGSAGGEPTEPAGGAPAATGGAPGAEPEPEPPSAGGVPNDASGGSGDVSEPEPPDGTSGAGEETSSTGEQAGGAGPEAPTPDDHDGGGDDGCSIAAPGGNASFGATVLGAGLLASLRRRRRRRAMY